MTLFLPDVSLQEARLGLQQLYLQGDPGLLAALLGDTAGTFRDTEEEDQEEDFGDDVDSDCNDAGDEEESEEECEDDDYEDTALSDFGDGSFVTSTGVKKNPIKTFSSGSVSTTQSASFAFSPVAGAEAGGSNHFDEEVKLLWASILMWPQLFSLQHHLEIKDFKSILLHGLLIFRIPLIRNFGIVMLSPRILFPVRRMTSCWRSPAPRRTPVWIRGCRVTRTPPPPPRPRPRPCWRTS